MKDNLSSNSSSHTNRLNANVTSLDNHSSNRTLINAPSHSSTIQRYPSPLDDDNAKTLSTLYSTSHRGREDKDFSSSDLNKIKSGVYMLTDLSPDDMQANCIGWSKGEDMFEDPSNIYQWKKEYTAVDPHSGEAKIILWGEKNDEDENKWSILHASVKLSHAEIAKRSEEFSGFSKITTQQLSKAGIPDPCWTSAGGFGYGVFVHPKDWFEGGDFGTALKGMK